MDRDLVGYADTPPRVTWPHGARVAISLVVNYEEGSENLLQDGVGRRESWGDAMSPVPADQRDLANESMFEYGSRVGVWRFLRIFAKYGVRSTFFACAVALERNPAVARAITAQGHDVCGHGNRWEEYYLMDREAERRAIHEGYAAIERLTGQPVERVVIPSFGGAPAVTQRAMAVKPFRAMRGAGSSSRRSFRPRRAGR